MKISASWLNLQSSPDASSDSNIMVSLANGELVQVLDSSRADGWWKVSVNFRRSLIEGYLWSKFLSDCSSARGETANAVVEVHLAPTARLGRPADAHPLGEPNAPRREGATPEARCGDLARIISFLDVAHSRRYVPTKTATFCNIYAYDYCYLAGVYLRRVWWVPRAIQELSEHQDVTVELGKTVDEMRANELESWFDQFGLQFGWQHTLDANDLQIAANEGSVAVIVAKNISECRPGHIVVVAPQTAQHKAQRSNGSVTVPLQSQAGQYNFPYGGSGKWWIIKNRFRAFGLWSNV